MLPNITTLSLADLQLQGAYPFITTMQYSEESGVGLVPNGFDFTW